MTSKNLTRLLGIIEYLRTSPDGCAWTKEQTHKSLTPYLIEESYEAAEMIDTDKHGEDLCGELGDMLLQIVLHAQLAAERGAFTFDDVAKSIADKLERRYPTILGDEANTLKTPEEIDRRWEEVKAEERKKKGIKPDSSVLDDVSTALPALMRATKLKGRVAKAGWDWTEIDQLFDRLNEEISEMRAEMEAPSPDKEKIAAEIGDVLFMMVNFAHWFNIDSEDALRTTNHRFERRFRHMEQGLKAKGKDFKTSTQEECRALWDEAKKNEKKS